MPTRRPRKAVREDDGRLRANRPAPLNPPEKTRMQKLIDGDITVEDLDDEEIMRVRVKDKAGGFTGRPRDMLPRKLIDAFRGEMLARLQDRWDESAAIGHQVMVEIATNPRASADARFKAAQYLVERVQGKVPDKVQMTHEVKPYEDDLVGILIDSADAEIVQGSVVPINRKREAS